MLLLPNHNQNFQACIYKGSNGYTCIGIKAIRLGEAVMGSHSCIPKVQGALVPMLQL